MTGRMVVRAVGAKLWAAKVMIMVLLHNRGSVKTGFWFCGRQGFGAL